MFKTDELQKRAEYLTDLRKRAETLTQEIEAALGGEVKKRSPQKCSICYGTDHTARTCPQRTQEKSPE